MKRTHGGALPGPAAKKGRLQKAPQPQKVLPLAQMAQNKKRVLGAELKNVDVDGTLTTGTNNINLAAGAATWNAPAAAFLLNGLAPGTSAITRLGRKVAWTKLVVRWSVSNQAGITQGGSVRIRIVFDRQSNAAAPAVLDIFTLNEFHAPNNLSNEDRFITVADIITEPLSIQNNWAVSGVIKRRLNLETIFNTGVAGTIADIQSGSMYIMASQNGTIATAGPTVSWYSRLRFVDY